MNTLVKDIEGRHQGEAWIYPGDTMCFLCRPGHGGLGQQGPCAKQRGLMLAEGTEQGSPAVTSLDPHVKQFAETAQQLSKEGGREGYKSQPQLRRQEEEMDRVGD